MAKNKISVKKSCPCGQQVAVACKTCPICKHSFYEAKRQSLGLSQPKPPVPTEPSTSIEDIPPGSSRRTSRVKREKPNYYDASEFEKKTKKQKRTGTGNPRGRPPKDPLAHGLKGRKKKKVHKVVQEVEEEEEPVVLNAEKQAKCTIILAELNRKFVGTTFRV